MIELDGAACIRCGRKASDGAVLQVHHKKYMSGLKLWEYDYEMCETLCKGCHAAEHGLIPPRVGWEYLGSDDLGDLCGNCDLCGTDIRYVFFIRHDQWESMSVGEMCCNDLTQTALASNEIESQQRFERRRTTFIHSTRWQQYSGHEYIKQKGHEIMVMSRNDGYLLHVDNHLGKTVFLEAEDAKEHIFNALEDGSLDRFLARQARVNRWARHP